MMTSVHVPLRSRDAVYGVRRLLKEAAKTCSAT